MANPSRRGQVGNPVSTGMQGDNYTPFSNTHFTLPHGLHLSAGYTLCQTDTPMLVEHMNPLGKTQICLEHLMDTVLQTLEYP